MGKSNQEASEFAADDNEECKEWFQSWSSCGSGSSVGQDEAQPRVWSCAAGAAGTPGEAAARCVGAGLPPQEQPAADAAALSGELAAAVTWEARAGREGVGGS